MLVLSAVFIISTFAGAGYIFLHRGRVNLSSAGAEAEKESGEADRPSQALSLTEKSTEDSAEDSTADSAANSAADSAMNEAENRAEDGAKTTQRTEQVRMGREITIQCFWTEPEGCAEPTLNQETFPIRS